MSDNFIDLTITSPPYDNLRDYKGYDFNFQEIAKELFRVTKQGGLVVWIVGDATENGSETLSSFRQVLYFNEIGFNVHDTMIWEKPSPLPQTKEGKRYTLSFEYMFVLSKGKVNKFNPIHTDCKLQGKVNKNKSTQRKVDGNMRQDRLLAREGTIVKPTKPLTNIWSIESKGFSGHPATFPEKLVNDHMISWSDENDLIYDPFMGSGTTAKISILNKRNWIGSEISVEYCEIIKNRILEVNYDWIF
jgi:site-specific DNA-methyltransferase (adenine-specific)